MTQDQLLSAKDALYGRLAHLAAKRFCPFRMFRLYRLNKRLDSLNRGLGAGKPHQG